MLLELDVFALKSNRYIFFCILKAIAAATVAAVIVTFKTQSSVNEFAG